MPHLLLNWFSLLAQAEGEHGATAAAPEYLFLNFVWVIPALPLLAFIINGLFGRRLGKTAGWIATILVGLSFLVDPLTAVMLMVVLSVGTLVHLYSNGYMEDDPDIARFFTYLPLFIFSML